MKKASDCLFEETNQKKTKKQNIVLNLWNFQLVVQEQIVTRRRRSVLIQALTVSGGKKKLW